MPTFSRWTCAPSRHAGITNSNALDTSPTYSPDGREIAFESDREGTQQLYVMGSDGSNVRRISLR